MVREEAEPYIRLGEVQSAIAVSPAGTPLSGEDSTASRLRAHDLVPQRLLVSGCVEMDRVRQVRARDWIQCCFVGMLTPVSIPQNDEVVGVCADDWDQLLVERFDNTGPGHSQRFVVGLEDNVVVTAIFLSHLIKEGLGFVDMILGVVIVPIDEDVDALRDGRVDDQLYLRLLSPWILQVAGTLVNAQHGTHQRALPVVNQPIDYRLCIILPLPLRPEEGHASQLYNIAM